VLPEMSLRSSTRTADRRPVRRFYNLGQMAPGPT
jgi:hypothetical protein